MKRTALLLSLLSFTATAQSQPSAPPLAPAQPAPPHTQAPATPRPEAQPSDASAPPETPANAPAMRAEDPATRAEVEFSTTRAREDQRGATLSFSVRGSASRHRCPESDWDDSDDTGTPSVLAPLRLSIDGRAHDVGRIELHGLQRLDAGQVRSLVGIPDEGAVDARQADVLLHRLARTGLFARVEPRVQMTEGAPTVLDVTLEENPLITRVTFAGLQDVQARELMDSLFFRTADLRDEDTDNEDEDENDEERPSGFVATLRVHGARGTLSVSRPCPSSEPPAAWLARVERGVFHPGIMLGGVPRALEHALRELRDEGYLLADLTADLDAQGRLRVQVDEGRLEEVDVRGVDADTAAQVREALGLNKGDVFLRSDARRAARRLESRLPFLRLQDVGDDGLDPKGEVRVTEEPVPEGGWRYHAAIAEEPPRRHTQESPDPEWTWTRYFGEGAWDWDTEGLSLEGRKLVVYLRPRPVSLRLRPLPVHTQVTGFAPGVTTQLRAWDPRNRVNPTVDAALFVPLRLRHQEIPDDPEGTRRQRRLNLLAGLKAQIPSAAVAELGVQAHDFTDTSDRWRMSDIDSALYSFLINRPDREYFRRKGLAAFATVRWTDTALVGVEYRNDRYESMQSFAPPLSLFRRDSAPFTNSPISEGRFESVVARLEYASEAKASTKVGSLFRTPETSLFQLDSDDDRRLALRSLVTLEVGHGPNEDGADARFWKLVADATAELPTGWHSGLQLRARVAGGHALPLQKQEALGGWTALRGYGFKEFRGDVSVLGTCEYRWHAFGLFADVGSVHSTEGWADARLGAGGSFHFGEGVRFDVAWRTDDQASATPEARLFFERTF
ncbi:hypothetical protein DRW03_30030 [Corallococcus sp. H22C18031201]|nr:hypothetical protein DRW03_30030 [Corallococcus sp. H22C18031201]